MPREPSGVVSPCHLCCSGPSTGPTGNQSSLSGWCSSRPALKLKLWRPKARSARREQRVAGGLVPHRAMLLPPGTRCCQQLPTRPPHSSPVPSHLVPSRSLSGQQPPQEVASREMYLRPATEFALRQWGWGTSVNRGSTGPQHAATSLGPAATVPKACPPLAPSPCSSTDSPAKA